MNQKQFKTLRKWLGLSQAEMARQMGYYSGMVISNKERGVRGITKLDLLIINKKWKKELKAITEK